MSWQGVTHPGSLQTITPLSLVAECNYLNGTPTSLTVAATNEGYFFPFFLPEPRRFPRVFLVNGATVSGSIDLGVYSATGERLFSTGTVVQSGTSAIQWITPGTSPWDLAPGRYLLAISFSSGTATVMSLNPGTGNIVCANGFRVASAYQLPSTITIPSLYASMYAVQVFGLSSR